MLHSLFTVPLLLASAATQASAKYVWENFQNNQVGLISWQSHGGDHLSMRSYHVDNNGIRESVYNTGSSGWVTTDIGIAAHGDIVAGVHKYSDSPNDVIIRLFFQNKTAARTDPQTGESLRRMMSFYNDRGTGWRYDAEFEKTAGYVGKPRSVVKWQDRAGLIHWRLYFLSVTVKAGWSWQILAAALGRPEGAIDNEQLDIATMYRKNTIYEASLIQSTAQPGLEPWTMGNGGAGLDTFDSEPWGHIGLSAVSWGNGTRISVLYWYNNEISSDRHGRIKEKRWKNGEGWTSPDLPNDDWKWFRSTFGSVAAVTWTDLKNVDQIRLYVKWVDVNNGKNRLIEFQANENGWGKQSSDFPDHAAAGGPMSATAWKLGNRVSIRIHAPKCKMFSVAGICQSVIVGETGFDTGSGWQQGAVVDGKDWAASRV